MTLRHVVFDFDGTCTRVEDVADTYVDHCIELFQREVRAGTESALREAMDRIRLVSPGVGWMLGGTPAAPAAADPYILFGEAIRVVVKELGITTPVPADIHARANDFAEAPWREEVVDVLEAFHAKGIVIHFVSNSKTAKIEHRLDTLLARKPAVRAAVAVLGDAGKFRIRELDDASIPAALQQVFRALPAADGLVDGRPLYLRRGGYFEALCALWGGQNLAAETLVCGDIWELDLALPIALGAQVHLVRREEPYPTYAYETDAVKSLGARASYGTLRDVLARF